MTRVIRPVAVPLLLLIFAAATAGVGISSALVSHYGSNFRGSLGGWTKALLAMFCLASFMSIFELLGLLFASAIVGSLLFNVITWGIVWLFAVVLSSGLVVALSHNGCALWRCWGFGVFSSNCVNTRCGLFRWQEGLGWAVCWLAFFLVLNAIVSRWLNRDEPADEWVSLPAYVSAPSPNPPAVTTSEQAAAVHPVARTSQMAQTTTQ